MMQKGAALPVDWRLASASVEAHAVSRVDIAWKTLIAGTYAGVPSSMSTDEWPKPSVAFEL